MHALLMLTRANIRSFVRDRAALFWTLAFPVIFILLFGAIFSGADSTSYKVGWVDQDRTEASAGLRSGFAGVTIFELRDGSLDDSLDAMRKGGLSGIVVVPAGYGAAVAAAVGQPGASNAPSTSNAPSASGATGASNAPAVTLEVYTDPSQNTTSMTIQQVCAQVVGSTNLALRGGAPVIATTGRSLQTGNLSAAAFLVPGILGMALMQLGMFGAVPLVAQREKLILKRLGATPLPRWTLVGSNVILRLIIGLVQSVLIVGIGIAVFGVTILGNIALMAGIVVLGALAFISMGYLVASFARTEDSTNGIVQVIQFPMMFLAGTFFPLEALPSVLRPIATILPLTYLGDALRQVMVGGSAFAPLPVDLAVLGAWFVGCLLISARFFRWE